MICYCYCSEESCLSVGLMIENQQNISNFNVKYQIEPKSLAFNHVVTLEGVLEGRNSFMFDATTFNLCE